MHQKILLREALVNLSGPSGFNKNMTNITLPTDANPSNIPHSFLIFEV